MTATSHTPRPTPRGFALLELLVVLVLLGLSVTLAVVAARPEDGRATPAPRERLLATARGEAVHRAQDVVLAVEGDGQWSLRIATGERQMLRNGRLPEAIAPFRVRMDALGNCLPDAPGAWDAGSCREVPSR